MRSRRELNALVLYLEQKQRKIFNCGEFMKFDIAEEYSLYRAGLKSGP